MKYYFFLPALLMVLFPLFTYAQKDAPVAGHAAVLTDLLKKNYNAIEPAQREDEINRDRTQVLAIFKSYLQDSELSDISATGFDAAKNRLKKSQDSLTVVKRNFDSYVSSNNKDTHELSELSDKLEKVVSSVNEQRTNIDLMELAAVKIAYSKNKLVDTVIGKFIVKYNSLQKGKIDINASANAAADIQKSIPFLGGNLGFETIIDGLGRFIAKRLKEELTTYAIDRVKQWLLNPDPNDPLTDLKILLPKTSNYLLGFKADQVTNFPNEIKQYIEDDLSHILDNAGNLRNTPRVERLLLQYPDLDFAFEALQLIPQISKVKTPVDYFTILESSRNINRWKGNANQPVQFNIANGVSLTGLLARSLVVVDNGEKRFAGTEFLTAYAQESTFYSLYAGFIYQQDLKYYNIKFLNCDKQTITFSESYNKKIVNAGINATNIEFIREIVTRTVQNAEKVFNNATELRKASKAGQKPGADTIYNFVKSIIDFSEDATHAADTLLDFVKSDRSELQLYHLMYPYFSVANTTNEVMYDIQQKKYTTALLKALEVTAPLVSRNKVSGVNTLAQSLSNSAYSLAAAHWSEVARCFKDTTGVSTGKHVKSIPAREKLRESLIIVASELNKIKLYYRVNYSETALNDPLNEFISVCEQGSAVKTIVRNDSLKRVIALISSNKDFQELVISYYANTNIKSSIDHLNTQMANLKIEGTAGKPEIPLILPSERDTITASINNYVTALFGYFTDNSARKNLDAAQQNMEAAIRRGLASIPQQTNPQLNSHVVSLIHFVNDMAEAKDAGDVETAIEAFVLPAGSYAIKRKARYNFSLNSYPGLLGSYEITPEKGNSFSTGFTAPVGLSLSWGSRNEGSLGLFLSIIDIGAVTRLRLDSSKATDMLPEFSFKNILAPGLYFVYGFPNTPLSLYGGAQYGPQLRAIEDKDNYRNYDSYRLSLGIVMDLPLLNLHTRPH
ncbi:hypothetical protein [Chitinophaga polysaccharea]|uniref:hypothetical protein n=1 Tax=Chitinophaga polysaccharea TaxID=1293035 RepID=UPI0011572ADF|nr:hypothetical protein [Chitinophaga polysaccharea]